MSAVQQKSRARAFIVSLDALFLLLVVIYLVVPLIATLVFGLQGGKGLDVQIGRAHV